VEEILDEEPKEAEGPEPIQIDTTNSVDPKPVPEQMQIGKKRANPRQVSSVSKPSSGN
jgi:hypothetical protein